MNAQTITAETIKNLKLLVEELPVFDHPIKEEIISDDENCTNDNDGGIVKHEAPNKVVAEVYDTKMKENAKGAEKTSKSNDEKQSQNSNDSGQLNAEPAEPHIFRCTKCDRRFFKKYLLEAHIRGAHEGVERPFICSKCPKNFKIYLLLNRHVRLKHPPNDGTPRPKVYYDCELCDKKFARKDNLNEHVRGVHERLRKYKCNICAKIFGSRRSQQRHENSHCCKKDDYPYVCEHCHKRYKIEYHFQIHQQCHAPNPNLVCPICNFRSANVTEFEKHIKKHEKSRRKFLCPKCGKTFTKLLSVHEHDLTVHLKLQPYKCRFCNLAFAARKSLKLHEKNHDSTGRTEHCSICEQYFATKRSFRLHMTKKHPDEKKTQMKSNPKLTFNLWS